MILTAAATCLALNIFFEGRGEDLMGKVAIAEVTMNRVESPKHPDNICAVVWDKKQFSWTHDGKHDDPTRFTAKVDRIAWRDSQLIAQMVIDNEIRLDVKGATHYHADYVEPYWAKHHTMLFKLGTHIFYK